MYFYHALINTLSAHMIHITLNILYIHRGDCLTGDPEKVDVGWLPVLSPGLSEECWPLIPVQSFGPSSKCWPSIASAVPWAFTRVLALDCQCSPMGLHQSAGPWFPVQSPGPSPECWPLIASAVPWTFTRVLALDCQCSPEDLHQSAGPWLPVQWSGSPAECGCWEWPSFMSLLSVCTVAVSSSSGSWRCAFRTVYQ